MAGCLKSFTWLWGFLASRRGERRVFLDGASGWTRGDCLGFPRVEQRWWTVADLLIYYLHEPGDHDEEHFPVKILRLIHTRLVAKPPLNEQILK